jgi:hypothetical protein
MQEKICLHSWKVKKNKAHLLFFIKAPMAFALDITQKKHRFLMQTRLDCDSVHS